MDTLTEIRRQVRWLRDDGRVPVAIEVGPDALEDLRCSRAFRSGWEMYSGEAPDPGGVWKVYGLVVRARPGPGVRVLPDDWRGDGQGRVRV